MNEKISRALAVLPDRPGVYLMRDDKGKIIYVGKAVVLKNRVRSYFRNLAAHTPKVKAMVAKIDDSSRLFTWRKYDFLICTEYWRYGGCNWWRRIGRSFPY